MERSWRSAGTPTCLPATSFTSTSTARGGWSGPVAPISAATGNSTEPEPLLTPVSGEPPISRERRSELIRAPLEALLRLYDVSMQRPGAAEVCGLLDATTDDLAFGPTELSVAFSSTAPPAVRCLAEVLDAAPPSELRVSQALDAVRRLAAVVSDRNHDLLSQIDRLAALFEVVYLDRN